MTFGSPFQDFHSGVIALSINGDHVAWNSIAVVERPAVKHLILRVLTYYRVELDSVKLHLVGVPVARVFFDLNYLVHLPILELERTIAYVFLAYPIISGIIDCAVLFDCFRVDREPGIMLNNVVADQQDDCRRHPCHH